MPDSGDLRGVEASQRPDSQVRVFAMPPREGAGPDQVVQGFLEALTSDDPKFEMARRYLTGPAAKAWRPELSTTVLAEGPNPEQISDRGGYDGDDGRLFALRGHKVASIDEQHAYQPADASYSEVVRLRPVNEGGHREWRIDRPPSGIVLGASDFQRIYRPVNKYYYEASGPGTGDIGIDTPGRLVADPVYVRQRVDPVTQTVRALLDGPTRWLNPMVQTSFPSGTQLKAGVKALSPDDQNRLKVPLNAKAERVGRAQCQRMAAQVVFTLQDLTSTGITDVELQRSDGSPLCEMDENQAAPMHAADRVGYQYFLDSEHRLVRLPGTGTGSHEPAQRVPGPFGKGDKPMGTIAVSRDELHAAGVTLNGRDLYVGDMLSGASYGAAVLHSDAKSESDRLTAPSWDGHGDLWVADRDPDKPRLLMLEHGTGNVVTVTTEGLDPARIDAVRLAADGVRIALLVEQDGKEQLKVGRVQRLGGEEHPQVTVADLRPGAPQMEEVTAMSWAGDSRLVVVGREHGGVQQVRYVQCDGSAPASGVLPGLTGVKEIAAAEDDRLPLLAHSDDGIVRMPPGAPWQTVLKTGTSPVYPG
ncbi:LpqB family beta-propeller domain-containing protein [Streptomyces sp. TS71-3]|uniref:LpqB family beta-propeller domain-containing protein n=1 Tax=Streptomyces sp. TS71-3 TaxID=2733862 RepID=UPI001BB4172D|nr:LpqB family beta-propeller domain-containing protein [Streptomyces sp. TS71-3]